MPSKSNPSKSKILVRAADAELPMPGGNHTPQENKNLDLVGTFYNFHEARDDEGLLSTLTEDCDYVIGAGASETSVPYHGIYHGKAQIAAYLLKKRTFTIRPFCGMRTSALVDGPFVVIFGKVEDQFATSHFRIHWCPFLQFFVVDETQNLISRMEYFVDTAATAMAWDRVIKNGTPANKA